LNTEKIGMYMHKLGTLYVLHCEMIVFVK